MPLVNTIKSEDDLTLPERVATEAYVPMSDQHSSVATVLVRKPRRLDVDEVLARSLPSPGAYANKDIKTNVLR
jgi:hypothetical protein